MRAQPQVIHRLPGRIRVHVPALSRSAPEALERTLRRIPGVTRASLNPHTHNILVQYDDRVVSHNTLLDQIADLTSTPCPDAVSRRALGMAAPARDTGPSTTEIARWVLGVAKLAMNFFEGPLGWLATAIELIEAACNLIGPPASAQGSTHLASIRLFGPFSLTLGLKIDPPPFAFGLN